MNGLEAVIFDMDGVIFDTEKYYLNIWTEVFSRRGYKLNPDIYISLMGTGRANVIKVFKESYGQSLPMDEMYKEKDDMLLNAIKNNMVPIKDGAEEILRFLKENNIKTALATSSRRERLRIQMEMHDIFKLFDTVVSGEDVQRGKPYPDIFIKAADKIKAQYKKCIVIEDSLSGIKGAHKAGMYPIHVEDLKKADEEILMYCKKNFRNLKEIQEYIGQTYIK